MTHATQNLITDPRFFSAGKALFTVSGPKDHRTYKIRKKASPGKDPVFFVSVRKADGFDYLGLFNPDVGDVRVTRNGIFAEDSKEVKGVRFAVARLTKHLPMPEGYAVQHEGCCGRCGMVLTDPVSIERGIGPECWKRGGF